MASRPPVGVSGGGAAGFGGDIFPGLPRRNHAGAAIWHGVNHRLAAAFRRQKLDQSAVGGEAEGDRLFGIILAQLGENFVPLTTGRLLRLGDAGGKYHGGNGNGGGGGDGEAKHGPSLRR